MFDLYRFFEKEQYVTDFLNGDLYMNSIGHFWAVGTEHPQNDLHEGLGEALSAEEYKALYGWDFRETFGDNLFLPLMNRLEAMKYAHVCCFYLHEYDVNARLVTKINPKMNHLGKYAVRVYNVQAFVDRILDKLVKGGLYGLMGPMNYHSPLEKGRYFDLFDKTTKYSHEQEWRFTLIPDYERAKELAAEDVNRKYDEHVYFRIGKLGDIAEEVDGYLLFNGIEDIYEKDGIKYKAVDALPIPWCERRKTVEAVANAGLPVSYDIYPDQYVGWGPREAYRRKLMEIDGGRFKPLLTIG